MTPAAERVHRLLLLLLSLVLLAAGILALLVGLGTFGTRLRHRAVFDNLVSRYIGDHGIWLWPVVAVLGLVLAYLALRWFATLFAVHRTTHVDLSTRGAAGHSDVDSAAVTTALTTQVERYRDVTGASARVSGDAKDPHLALTVTATADADLPALHQRIETDALTDLRHSLERPDLPVQLDLQISSKTAARTR
jgi:hypothetical protein